MLLITGANGLVGSEICKHFKSIGVDFLALKRKSSELTLLDDATINWVEGDVLDSWQIREIIKANNIKRIIHCAAIVSYHRQDEPLMDAVNVRGTQNLIDASIDLDVEHFIHISSIAAIGRNPDKNTIVETDHWVESSMNSAYARTKYLAELEVWRGHHEGVNCCVVNPSVVIASGDGQRSSSKLLKYIWDEKKFYTKGKLNYVDARDVAMFVGEIFMKKTNNERFILNAGNIEYDKLFGLIASNFGKQSPTIKVGPIALMLVYFIDQLKFFITRIRPTVTKEMLKSTKADFLYVNDKSRNFFGLEYRSINDTIEWACESFKQGRKG